MAKKVTRLSSTPGPPNVGMQSVYDAPIMPEVTLESEKKLYHEFVKSAFDRAIDSAIVEIADGVVANASRQAFSDVQGLILTTPAGTSVRFRDAGNEYHEADKEDMEAIAKKIAERQQALRQSKWELDQAVDAATSIEELHQINVVVE